MLFCVVLNQKGSAALKANKRAKVNDNLKQQFYNYCIISYNFDFLVILDCENYDKCPK